MNNQNVKVWKFGTTYVDPELMLKNNIAYAYGDSMPTYLKKNRISEIYVDDIIVVASGKKDDIKYVGICESSPFYLNEENCEFNEYGIKSSEDKYINDILKKYDDVVYVKVKWLKTSEINIKGSYNYIGFSAINTEIKSDIKILVNAILENSLKQKNMQKYTDLLNSKKNLILSGAPGTGKTYTTAEIAVGLIDPSFTYSNRKELMQKYQELVKEGQIAFTTFHQSMDYEEFVEGLKPDTEEVGKFEVKAGIFKQMCEKAKTVNAIKIGNFTDFSLDNYEKYLQNLGLKEITIRNYKHRIEQLLGKVLNAKKDLVNYQTYKTLDEICESLEDIKDFDSKNNFHNNFTAAVGNLIVFKNNFPTAQNKNSEIEPNCILIIDEINRGNISKILGELITLLEADKRLGETNEISVTLPYSNEQFSVPQNLYIIGTMNTADRSLGYIDYAIRRRFAFVTLKADKTILENYYTNEILKNKAIALFTAVSDLISKNISPEFNAEDLMIGHSYFMAKDEAELLQKLEYEIKPLLREYRNDGILNVGKEEIEKLDVNYQIKEKITENGN